MISDLDSGALGERLHGHVCVVGGGAVGLSLAVSLAEAGVDTLLLEAGGPTLETQSHELQQGSSVGHPFQSIGVGRYRVLGGSTLYWGGQVAPFDGFVTGERPWVEQAGWPVPAAELATYFDRAYRLLGLGDAELDDEAVWQRIAPPGVDLGPGLQMVMTRWLKTRNLARLFAAPLKAHPRLRVVTHANVTALRLGEDRRAVRSVQVRSLNGKTAEVEARHFVLCNGTLEVVRTLLHPLADSSPAPWHGSRHLGAPLVDHLDCVAGTVDVRDYERFHQMFDSLYLGPHRYYPKLRLSPQAQRTEGLVDIAAQFAYRTRFSEHLEHLKMFLRSIKDGGVPVSVGDAEAGDAYAASQHKASVSLRALPRHLAAVVGTSLPLAVRYFKDRRSFKPRDAEVSLTLFCEQLPTARSRVRLGDQVDALGLRRLQVDWQIDGREMTTMRRFSLLMHEVLSSQGIAGIRLDPRLLALDPSFLSEIHDSIHQMGTTRMSSDPAEGFVDPDLRVHGIANLHIAGAAVFPSTGFANPTFTAIALALRLSDHLAAAAP